MRLKNLGVVPVGLDDPTAIMSYPIGSSLAENEYKMAKDSFKNNVWTKIEDKKGYLYEGELSEIQNSVREEKYAKKQKVFIHNQTQFDEVDDDPPPKPDLSDT